MPVPGSSGVILRAGLVLALITGAAACSPQPAVDQDAVVAPGGFVADTKPVPQVRWAAAEVAAGTPLKVVLLQEAGPGISRQGTRVEARITEAVVVGNLVAVPAGSVVHGVVVEASPGHAGAGGAASLTLLFERITTPTGADSALVARHRRRGTEAEVVMRKDMPFMVMLEKPMSIQVKQ